MAEAPIIEKLRKSLMCVHLGDYAILETQLTTRTVSRQGKKVEGVGP